jgi:hypothetical protein
VYYEFGQQFNIGNPTLSTRYHQGQVVDQDFSTGVPAQFNFYNGDAYFRRRNIVLSESGAATFNVLDRNFVDFYISAVNDIDGRPSIIDINAKRATYDAMVRFGQAYQPNTNINGLNRFFPNNFDEYDLSYGAIKRVKVRDRGIRIFQEQKVGSVPVFNQISKNADGTQLLVVTDKLLNPIQYYSGNYGIGEHSESLASFNFADYFCSQTGDICRVSNDGVTPISVLYKVNSFSKSQLPLRTGNYKIYGCFQPSKLGNYIIALEATASQPAATLSFAEEGNSFESFLSYQPEMMCSLNNLLIAFKNGALYTHDSDTYNNFFGVQYDSHFTPVFNLAAPIKKTPLSITQVASRVWDCPAIETNNISYGTTPQQSSLIEEDFTNYEGQYSAALLRDANSIGGLLEGDILKSDWCKIKFRAESADELCSLNIVSLSYIPSPYNTK